MTQQRVAVAVRELLADDEARGQIAAAAASLYNARFRADRLIESLMAAECPS